MMSDRFLTQIFYPNNKFDSPEYIQNLVPYFCSNEYMLTIASKVKETEPVVLSEYFTKSLFEISPCPSIIPVPVSVSGFTESRSTIPLICRSIWFEPLQQDTLFWCVFYHCFPDEYEMIHNRFGNRELEEKQKIMEFFRKDLKALKTSNYKVTNGMMQEILSEMLLDTKKTSFIGIIALSIFYKKRIYLIDDVKNIYLIFDTSALGNGDLVESIYIYKNTQSNYNGKYRLNTSDVIPDLSGMLCLHHYTKSLQSIGAYKTPELEEIASKLGIDLSSDKKLKKNDIYEKLVECTVFVL